MESHGVVPVADALARERNWLSRLGATPVVGAGFALSAILTAAAAGLGSSPSLSGALGPASPMVLTLLGVNVALLAALGALIGRRVLGLVGEQSGDASARLHVRFVAYFAIAAVAPALVVALFFGLLVTRGVESWFNARVETVVENSATVARSYI